MEHIGAMAHSLTGRPAWQKFFTITIRLDERDDRLRSGMTVRANVLAYHQSKALLIPRVVVGWQDGQSRVLKAGSGPEAVAIELGRGNATHFEVRSGLEPGDQVAAP